MNESTLLDTRVLFVILTIFYTIDGMAQNSDFAVSSAVTITSGQYKDAIALKNMRGVGARLSGESENKWGMTIGMRSTRTGMQPIVPNPHQDQDDWMLSAHVHLSSTSIPGRWTFGLDTYRTTNDAQAIGNNVSAWAPKISWQSHVLPLKLDSSYSQSQYQRLNRIDQSTVGVTYGFNQGRDWAQLRGTRIQNLTPSAALGKSTVNATDIKYTRILSHASGWIPNAVTLGVEYGNSIYFIDTDTKNLYNLPMMNQGGKNIALSWKINTSTDLNAQWSRNQYLTDQPWMHRFALEVFNLQVKKVW